MRYDTKILYLLIILIIPQFSSASTIKQLDVPELLQQSEIVFEGQVIKTEARWNDTQTNIFTEITFRVDDVVVGSYTSRNLILRFLGGTIGQTTFSIHGSKLPPLNESGVYFVSSTTQRLVNPLAGWTQGHFLTKQDDDGTMRILTQDEAPVAGIDLSQKSSKLISDGNVTGLTRSESGEISSAMTLADFKALLKNQTSGSSKEGAK